MKIFIFLNIKYFILYIEIIIKQNNFKIKNKIILVMNIDNFKFLKIY